MSSNSNASSGGIGFCGLLAIAFIVLKLTNFIDWSWLWVLAPLWIPASIGVTILIIFLIFALVAAICKKWKSSIINTFHSKASLPSIYLVWCLSEAPGETLTQGYWITKRFTLPRWGSWGICHFICCIYWNGLLGCLEKVTLIETSLLNVKPMLMKTISNTSAPEDDGQCGGNNMMGP